MPGQVPFATAAVLCIHFIWQWFILSEPATEEALHGISMFRETALLHRSQPLPDGNTIVDGLPCAKGPMLKVGTVTVGDVSLVGVPSSTKSGMQGHIGMDAGFAPTHTVEGTAANDVTLVGKRGHGHAGWESFSPPLACVRWQRSSGTVRTREEHCLEVTMNEQ